MPLQFKPAVFVAVAPVILAAIALLLLRLRFFGSISSLCARFSYLLVVSEDPEDTESGEEPITQDDAWYVWQKVVVLALPEYPYLIGALLTALFTTACDFLQPLFIGMALDTVANPSTAHLSLSTIFTILVVVQLIRGLAEYGRERLNNNIGDFVRHRAQDLYVSKVLSFEVGFFDRTHTSDLNKLYHNLNDIHGLAGHQVPRIIRSALTVLCAGSYMIYVDPLLGSIVLFFILLQALAEKIAGGPDIPFFNDN